MLCVHVCSHTVYMYCSVGGRVQQLVCWFSVCTYTCTVKPGLSKLWLYMHMLISDLNFLNVFSWAQLVWTIAVALYCTWCVGMRIESMYCRYACMGGNVWQGGYLRDLPFTCRVTKQFVHGYMDLKYGLFIHALCNYLVEYVGVSSENRAVYWVMREEIKVGYIQLKFQGRMRFSHILYMYTCVVPKQVSFLPSRQFIWRQSRIVLFSISVHSS